MVVKDVAYFIKGTIVVLAIFKGFLGASQITIFISVHSIVLLTSYANIIIYQSQTAFPLALQNTIRDLRAVLIGGEQVILMTGLTKSILDLNTVNGLTNSVIFE
jgi:hypothetical protein